MCSGERKNEQERLVPKSSADAQTSEACKAKAVKDYKAKNKKELTLIIGQILDIIDRTQKDWWMGQVEGQSAFGWFPSVNVVVIDEKEAIFEMEKRRLASEKTKKEEQKEELHREVSNPSIRKSMTVNTEGRVIRATVITAYDGQSVAGGPSEDKLPLEVGQIVIITDKHQLEWWLGTLQGKKTRGWFPAVNVELLPIED